MEDLNPISSQNRANALGERLFPEEEGSLAGYAALIVQYQLHVPLPEKLSFIGAHHQRRETESWLIYTERHQPENSLSGHLTFALRYEGVDLAILKALFDKVNPKDLETWILSEPTSKYSRRVWFFYEWLTGKPLDIPDATSANFEDAIDQKLQFAGASIPSRRHRIHNNMPGNPNFCPLVRRTEKLEQMMALHLEEKAKEKTGAIHPDVLARAAAFMLLKDSQASFAIESENPGKNRTERWGRAIGQAGLTPLTQEELIRLQRIVIEDFRFVKLGLRKEGGFVGVHDRTTNKPLPDHISAKWQDLPVLMEGLIEAYNSMKTAPIDPIVLATVIAFGFVFIHPFEDGNGRIQRYLIHHVLAEVSFAPKGIVFPVSAVILDRIDEYRRVLESYSRPRLDLIEWKPTLNGNVEVLNETLDLYRYFDATRQAEFLYDCVLQTIEKNLPEEILYLEQYDTLKAAITNRFDMPNHTLDLLIRFLHQNKGVLSKRAREKEFKELTDEECSDLETMYGSVFGE